jgi:hypothetical protein
MKMSDFIINNNSIILGLILLCLPAKMYAQVQVREEPRHKNILENKYIRVLDVRIAPGDTTLFHIHSTPSLFLLYTSTRVGSQLKDSAWEKGLNEAGEVSYNSFSPDIRVHRVSNIDTVPFHVNDIELLSSYQPVSGLKPLAYTGLLINERAFAYRITEPGNKQVISGRGPIIATLVEGDDILFQEEGNKKTASLKAGNILYFKPGSTFYFTPTTSRKFNMVLIEIK